MIKVTITNEKEGNGLEEEGAVLWHQVTQLRATDLGLHFLHWLNVRLTSYVLSLPEDTW